MTGCGEPTYVIGTNGDTKIPCGSTVTRFGGAAPYYCDTCRAATTQSMTDAERDRMHARVLAALRDLA